MSPQIPEFQFDWIDPLSRLARRINHTLTSRYQEILRISLSAATLLKVVHSQTTEQWTQTELARELCLSESTVCTLVEQLRQQGLIERQRLKIDRRKTFVCVTSTGKDLVARIHVLDAEMTAIMKRQVDPGDEAAWQETLARISHVFAHFETTVGTQNRKAA